MLTHTHFFFFNITIRATDMHTDTNLPLLKPSSPLYPTVLIKAERLQKVGANNKATYYI